MDFKTRIITGFFMASIVLFIGYGCNQDDDIDQDAINGGNNVNPPVQEGTASLDIKLAASYQLKSTGIYNAVNVDIQQISFHTSGDSTVTSGWFDLETTPGIYNLMDFVADDTLIAFDSLVATQTISQLRLLLGDSNTVMVDSVLYDLSTPAGQSSGIKLQVHTQMEPDSTYVIMLDFDPEESVKQTGNGKYKLQPVIRTIINP